jgi:hypothetical protein
VEMHEPYTYLNGLTIKDLEDLIEDIKVSIWWCPYSVRELCISTNVVHPKPLTCSFIWDHYNDFMFISQLKTLLYH